MPTYRIPVGLGLAADDVGYGLVDGVWTDGANVRFGDGFAQRFSGHAKAFGASPAATAYHVASFPSGTSRYWVYSGLASTWVHDGTTETDITGTALTGAATDRFTSCVLGGIYVQNNGKDVPSYWTGSTAANLTTLTDWDAAWRCRSMRAFKSFLIALNVTKTATNYGSMVKWSDAAVPGAIPASWDETDKTKSAGEFDLAETADAIVDGMPMGDMFLVYKDRSTYALQFVGGASVFRSARLPGDHGCLAPGCVAQTPLGHVVLTPSDVILHNGASVRSIVDGRMRRWLFASMDGASFGLSFVAPNPARSEVWVCFPMTGATGCTRALVWNYATDSFGVRDLPGVYAGAVGPMPSAALGTWAGSTDRWSEATKAWDQLDISEADQRMLVAGSEVLLTDQTSKFDGTAFTSRLTRVGMTMGDADSVKTIRSVTPHVDAAAGTVLSIQAGGSMSAEAGTVWSQPVTYTVGSTRKADLFATGRFLGLKISSTTGAWRLKHIDMDVVMRGKY